MHSLPSHLLHPRKITPIWLKLLVSLDINAKYHHCAISNIRLKLFKRVLVCNSIQGEAALADAGLSYDHIQQAVVGYVYGKFFFINSDS